MSTAVPHWALLALVCPTASYRRTTQCLCLLPYFLLSLFLMSQQVPLPPRRLLQLLCFPGGTSFRALHRFHLASQSGWRWQGWISGDVAAGWLCSLITVFQTCLTTTPSEKYVMSHPLHTPTCGYVKLKQVLCNNTYPHCTRCIWIISILFYTFFLKKNAHCDLLS